jgi:hypothetical protein
MTQEIVVTGPYMPGEHWVEYEKNLRENLVESGLFKSDFIDSAILKIKDKYKYFDDLTYMNALDTGRVLSLEEKKKIGLPTRRKYFEGFIAFIDVKNLHGRCPRSIFGNVLSRAWFRTHQAIELAKIKASPYVKTVKILVVDDCSAIEAAPKTYATNATPILPLPGCDAACCRCSYNIDDIKLD